MSKERDCVPESDFDVDKISLSESPVSLCVEENVVDTYEDCVMDEDRLIVGLRALRDSVLRDKAAARIALICVAKFADKPTPRK